MHYPRLLVAPVLLGILAAALPALAASGDVSTIALRDFNHNGKIDRAVISIANPAHASWSVRGTSGLAIKYDGRALRLADAFVASASSDPALLEVVLDETDPLLPSTSAADKFEITYTHVGLAAGVSDGSDELATIASGDVDAGDTELDQAGPVLLSSLPIAGSYDVTRTRDLTLVFSEPVDLSSLAPSSSQNPGQWGFSAVGDGSTVTVSHIAYNGGAEETFGIDGRDAAGNALVRDSYPNPFSFSVTTVTNPNLRVHTVFSLSSPGPLETITAGAPTVIAWYANQPEVASVRLSYSVNDRAYLPIATVRAPKNVYVWYPISANGTVRLRADALDASGLILNVATAGPLSMSVGAASALTVVSAPELSLPSASSATASIRLDRTPSSATFDCGALTTPVTVTGERPAHLEAALSGLTPGASYACRFNLTDTDGTVLHVDVPIFTAGVDTAAPSLVDPAVIGDFNAALGTARLTWTTNEASTADVRYGAYLNYGNAAYDAVLKDSHSLTLSGLTPGAMHQVRITSTDANGNAAVSRDYYFIFLREGELIKGEGSAVYWYKSGKRYAFPNETIYRSWFGADFSKVIRAPETQLGTIALGGNVKMKEGVYLLKIQSDPKTYAVEPDGALRWIQTEAQARALYGAAWAARVRDIDVSLFTDYAIGAPLQDGERPVGYAD